MSKIRKFSEWLVENHSEVECTNCGNIFTPNEQPTEMTCPDCGGYGQENAANFGDHGMHPCYHCSATGKVQGVKCPKCHEMTENIAPPSEEDRYRNQRAAWSNQNPFGDRDDMLPTPRVNPKPVVQRPLSKNEVPF